MKAEKAKKDRREYFKSYYLTHQEQGKKWRTTHPEQVKGYKRKWALLHPDKRKESVTKWYLANKERAKKTREKYRLEHLNQERKRAKEWAQTHKEHLKKYHLAHPKQRKEANKKYWKSLKGKTVQRRQEGKRRQFGFIPLNKPFEDSRGHHVDRERVIYIPTKMHEDNRHSVLANRNMEKINRLAFEFLERGI